MSAAELPEGWEAVTHENGLIIYHHAKSGAVSWTKPYVVDEEDAKVCEKVRHGFYEWQFVGMFLFQFSESKSQTFGKSGVCSRRV